MKYACLTLFVLTVLISRSAVASAVYPGCSVPSLKSGHHTFYVDPATGSLSGDGSAAHPWRTLADVVDPANKLISTQGHAGAAFGKGTDTALHLVNPDGPVKAGDLILLKTGDHGSPTISNMFNTDFITVAAAPGAAPVLGKLAVVSSAKWMFQGLTFQGMAATATGATTVVPPTGALVAAGSGDWAGATSDIVFDRNTIRAAATTSDWTAADWINKPYLFAMLVKAPCVNVTGNHISNVSNGLAVSANNSLVQGNTIELFSNDAIDLVASNLTVKGNTIKNGVNTPSDPWHPDGIQGWSRVTNGTTTTNTNVVLDGNTLLKFGDPAFTTMQGISLFDGRWNGLVVQNNVVVTNHSNAISIYGAQNATILNNTVIASDPTGHPSAIQVHDSKDGTASSGVTVRNNIATQFDIAKGDTMFDHNIAAATITTYPGGARTATTAGTVGAANAVVPAVLGGFVTADAAAGLFDLRLRPGSVAVGFGLAAGAPAFDILGRGRTAPADVGAYAH